MSNSGIVYVLNNPSMPNYIKIGKTASNVEERMKTLNNTSVPLPFICERASAVSDMDLVERNIHSAFGDCRINTKREFFEIDAERIIDILELVEIENVTPDFKADNMEEQIEVEWVIAKNAQIRSRFEFSAVGIKEGEELVFSKKDLNDEAFRATVIDSRKIKFRDEVMSLSKSVRIILNELGYKWQQVAGPSYWTYNGETLLDMRNRFEEQIED